MACVYLYKYNGQPIYVGKTKCFEQRIAFHRAEGWPFNMCEICYFEGLTDADADIYETFYINRLSPLWNKAKRFGVTRLDLPPLKFVQYSPQPHLEPSRRIEKMGKLYLDVFALMKSQESPEV